jgi:hypothetical protein
MMVSTEHGPTSHEVPLNKLKSGLNITASEFLDTIFAEVTDDEVVCVVKQSLKADGQSLFWQLPDDDPVFHTWLTRKSEQAWYFCVSSLGGERNEKGTALRRRDSDAVRYHCLVLDDCGSGEGSIGITAVVVKPRQSSCRVLLCRRRLSRRAFLSDFCPHR